jgi:Xaa-Pro aminopeptidase
MLLLAFFLLAQADAGVAPAPAPEGLTPAQLQRIQGALQLEKLDGWLFYDFRRSDPIAYRVLGLDEAGVRTRRWYCLVPARGEPRKLVHVIEPHALDGVPGKIATYSSWRARDHELGMLLREMRRVAMQYSPRNEIPTVANVDAGTLELVRSMGPEVVSSAELVAGVESTLSAEELASQARAAELLSADLEAVAQEAARRVREGHPASERELLEFVQARWAQEGMSGGGVVAADAHSADPHYQPLASGPALAGRGSILLLDFAARLGPKGIFADLTRVYFLGDKVPEEIARVAGFVFAARDAALALVMQRAEFGKLPLGSEVDAAARAVIAKAGYSDRFLHRTGHNIGVSGHGDGVNNDDFETHDVRRHLPDTCFSIEPGIYLAGRFGIRSEIDVCLPGGKVELRGGAGQTAVPALLP